MMMGKETHTTAFLESKKEMISHSGLLWWYLGLAVTGVAIASFSWALLPIIGIGYAILILAALTTLGVFAFFYQCRNWLLRMDHYPRTGPFAVLVSAAVITFVILISSGVGLLIPALFVAPFLFRSIIAGATYFTRLLDLNAKANSKNDDPKASMARRDFYAMLMGTAFGVFVMMLTVLTNSVAHINTLNFLAHGFALVAGVGSFAGLFSRPVGRERMDQEVLTIRIVFVISTIAAVLLCSLGLVPAIATTGLMTAGILGIPFYWFFVPSFIGAFVSLTDYVLKTAVYVLKQFGNTACEDYIIKHKKEHEYRWSAWGMFIGVGFGVALFALLVTQPHIFTALLIAKSLVGQIFVSIFMATAVSGAASRIGKSVGERERIEEGDSRQLVISSSIDSAPGGVASVLQAPYDSLHKRIEEEQRPAGLTVSNVGFCRKQILKPELVGGVNEEEHVRYFVNQNVGKDSQKQDDALISELSCRVNLLSAKNSASEVDALSYSITPSGTPFD